jgi:hypothetical protein
VVREKNNNQKNPPQTPHSTLADVARPADLKRRDFQKGRQLGVSAAAAAGGELDEQSAHGLKGTLQILIAKFFFG